MAIVRTNFARNIETMSPLRHIVPAHFPTIRMTNFKKLYGQQCHTALKTLLDWAGSPSELSRIAGMNRNAARHWQSQGKISKEAADTISKFAGCPLTREQIRPDIKVW